MRNVIGLAFFFFGVSLTAPPPPQTPPPAQAPPPPVVKENATVKLSDHVWVIPDNSVPMVPNVGIIVGSKATLVIDTGLGPPNGAAILREVAKVSRNAELYVVATHYHPEHVGGISAFPPGARFVASDAQKKDLDELAKDSIAAFSSRSAVAAEYLKDAVLRRPDVTFGREHTIDLGGIRARLLSLGPTHTRGDTAIFVPEDRVLFTGDIVFARGFLAFPATASVDAWVKVLDELDPLRPEKVVPSHGALGDGSSIGAQRGVLAAIQTRARSLKAEGKSADEAVQAVTAELRAKHPDWTGPNRLAGIVRSVYAEPR